MRTPNIRLIIYIVVGILFAAAAGYFILQYTGGDSAANTAADDQMAKAVQTAQVFAVQTQVANMHAQLTAKAPTATIPPKPTAEPALGATKTSPKDNMVMIYIPSGEFNMGASDSDVTAAGRPEEKPQHKVYLSGYWMDKFLVTNAQYDACFKAKSCGDRVHDGKKLNPYYGDPAYAFHPVTYVNWFDAAAYCKWAGRRLPTEAEWEKGARGTDGRLYPWGNDAPNALLANFGGGAGYTSVVGSYPKGASPYGLLDMAGNVREWVADWFSDTYYKDSPEKNPKGPDTGTLRGLRGGSWGDPIDNLRTTSRQQHLPDSPGDPRGFRCVSSK
jgi:eukaryotic-like serine/threonine-protein kinase